VVALSHRDARLRQSDATFSEWTGRN